MKARRAYKASKNRSNIYKYYQVKEIENVNESEKQMTNRSLYPQSPDTWRVLNNQIDTLNGSQESKEVNASSKHLTSYQNTNLNMDGVQNQENDNFLRSSPFQIIHIQGTKTNS